MGTSYIQAGQCVRWGLELWLVHLWYLILVTCGCHVGKHSQTKPACQQPMQWFWNIILVTNHGDFDWHGFHCMLSWKHPCKHYKGQQWHGVRLVTSLTTCCMYAHTHVLIQVCHCTHQCAGHHKYTCPYMAQFFPPWPFETGGRRSITILTGLLSWTTSSEWRILMLGGSQADQTWFPGGKNLLCPAVRTRPAGRGGASL